MDYKNIFDHKILTSRHNGVLPLHLGGTNLLGIPL